MSDADPAAQQSNEPKTPKTAVTAKSVERKSGRNRATAGIGSELAKTLKSIAEKAATEENAQYGAPSHRVHSLRASAEIKLAIDELQKHVSALREGFVALHAATQAKDEPAAQQASDSIAGAADSLLAWDRKVSRLAVRGRAFLVQIRLRGLGATYFERAKQRATLLAKDSSRARELDDAFASPSWLDSADKELRIVTFSSLALWLTIILLILAVNLLIINPLKHYLGAWMSQPALPANRTAEPALP